MCGRITNPRDLDANARDFDADVEAGAVWTPSYNVAPPQQLPVLGLRAGRRVVRTLRWGLVASWAHSTDMAARCINARAESVAERPAFQAAFAKRRCVVLVSGWYEWKAEGKVERPHWFHGARGELLPLAGLWERWADPTTGDELRTCAVITCAPNELAATIHDRMPVVLDRGDLDAWMTTATPVEALHALLRPCPAGWLGVHEVDRRVGKASENDERLIARAA
jgi:putative SOS response-associated peptidase YedK